MNALTQRLASRNKQRTTQRIQSQMVEARIGAATITGTLTGSSAEGITLRTESGGSLTVPRSTVQKLSRQPAIGQSRQLSTGGQLELLGSSTETVNQPVSQTQLQVRYPLRPPTQGSDFGANGDLWLEQTGIQGNFNEANAYVWIQKIGQFVKLASGGVVVTFEPNDPITSGTVNGQLHYNTTNSSVFFYDQAADIWRPVGGGGGGATINYVAGPPPTPAPPGTVDGEGHHDTVVDRLWTYDLANTTWRAAGSKNFFQGVPSAAGPTSFVRGDRVTLYQTSGNTVTPCDYIWSDQQSDWLLVSCCPGCAEDFFNSRCDDDEGSDGGSCTPLPP